MWGLLGEGAQTLAPPHGNRLQPGFAAVACNGELNPQVRRRQVRRGLVWPFDQTDALPCKVFVQTCFKVFLWLVEPIEIKVIQV